MSCRLRRNNSVLRKTKIVCTLGPASDSDEMVSKLMDAGMNVCRLNMSHGTYEEQGERIARIKRLRKEKGIPVAILLDTKGPEVRTKTLAAGKVDLEAGQEFVLTSREVEGDAHEVTITYPKMVELVKPGNRILIDDGLLAMNVVRVENGTDIVCCVVNGGTLGGRKGISVPDVDLQMPSIGEKDRADILFGIENGIDLIAASFVCRPSDVLTIRQLCDENGGSHVKIYSKIENRMGVDNFDEILKVSDGIMVARGDLGVEVDMEEVPILQKSFIRKCNVAAKPVITATQMLDSMIRNPRPTRAEASDVANAIIDGTDAIMLSGETAAGRDPALVVRVMSKIARQAERDAFELGYGAPAKYNSMTDDATGAICDAACTTARDIGASAIIALTKSGYTARCVSKYRPAQPIIAATPEDKTYHQLALSWGVYPVHALYQHEEDAMYRHAIDCAKMSGYIDTGDRVVITAGTSTHTGAATALRIQSVEKTR